MSLQELVFVPIHDEIKEHWTLAVICFPGLVVLPTAADGEGTEGGCAEGGGGGEGAAARGKGMRSEAADWHCTKRNGQVRTSSICIHISSIYLHVSLSGWPC